MCEWILEILCVFITNIDIRSSPNNQPPYNNNKHLPNQSTRVHYYFTY